MMISHLLRRLVLCGPIVTAIYALKHRVLVSHKAEVELSPRVTIGRGTVISSFSQIKTTGDGRLAIGERSAIGIGAHIAGGPGGVTLGDDCLVSQNVCIEGVNYRYDRLDQTFAEQGQTSKGIKIADNVWIGANCVILDGADIATGVIITPGSVVSGKIPANAIATGNPAKVIFTRR